MSSTVPAYSTVNPFRVLQKQAKQTLREWLFLKQVLAEVQEAYDYILVDCPPNIYMMTQNALVASNWYVVTTIPEYLSTIGHRILHRKVGEIGQRVVNIATMAGEGNIDIAKLGGIIFVKLRIGGSIITKQHYGQIAQMQQAFPGYCFECPTTELIGYSEAAESRLPIWFINTSSARRAAAKTEYEDITQEFLRRF